MNRPNGLRRRIIAASFAMAVLICSLFSVGLLGSLEYAESILFDSHIEADIATFISQYRQNPEVVSLPRHNFSVFVAPAGDTSGLPDYLRDLSVDEDEVVRDDREYHLDIRRQGDTLFYFLFDETAFDDFDQLVSVFVPLIIVFISTLAVIVGVAFSNRIVKPVSALAARVDSLESGGAIPAASPAPNDEIEVLSQAIDGFRARVQELLNREREFSSDVSHELRTPLMGIQAAAENLSVAGNSRERISELSGRIQARCAQMRELIEAMLTLARDPYSLENDFRDIRLSQVVRDQIDVASPHIQSKAADVRVIDSGDPVIHTSLAVLNVLFGNLLRNAIIHSNSREIHVALTDAGFEIRDFGQGMSDEVKSTIFKRYSTNGSDPARDIGIGLALVQRLCMHFKWTLHVESEAGRGTSVGVDFGDSRKG